MAAEGVTIQWKRIPKEVRKTDSGKLEVVSHLRDATEVQTEEFDSVLLAIGSISSTVLSFSQVYFKLNNKY